MVQPGVKPALWPTLADVRVALQELYWETEQTETLLGLLEDMVLENDRAILEDEADGGHEDE